MQPRLKVKWCQPRVARDSKAFWTHSLSAYKPTQDRGLYLGWKQKTHLRLTRTHAHSHTPGRALPALGLLFHWSGT